MQEIVKRKQGQAFLVSEKQILMNVVNYHLNQGNDSLSNVIKQVAEMCGVCEKTLYTVRNEYTSPTGLLPSKERPKKRQISTSRKSTYDEGVRNHIRRIVHHFFRENLPPTLNTLLAEVNGDENLPTFSRATLHRLLADMEFVYAKRGRNSILIEKEEIILWRHRYLRTIRKYRQENYNIVYLDESWVNIGHSVQREWVDKSIKSHRDAYIRGLTTGLKAPTSRGPRFVLLHAGGTHGFINGAELTFLAKKNTQDYHDEMDGPVFEEWFKNNLIPNLPEKTVVVMDNASYHSRKLEKIPGTSSTKEEIKEWLRSKDIFFEEDYLKAELLQVVKSFKPNYNSYIIEDIARDENVKILRLPPYHCELNPIEMVWSEAKRYVAGKNTNFKENEVRNLIKEAYLQITPEKWANYVNHVKAIEQSMWDIDNIMDDIQPIVIHLNAESDTESEIDNDT